MPLINIISGYYRLCLCKMCGFDMQMAPTFCLECRLSDDRAPRMSDQINEPVSCNCAHKVVCLDTGYVDTEKMRVGQLEREQAESSFQTASTSSQSLPVPSSRSPSASLHLPTEVIAELGTI